MQRAGSIAPQPLRFGPRVRILEMRGTKRIGVGEAMGTGWEAPIREDEGGMVARIAEVGHHVNCIPDCGLLKSSALHPSPPNFPCLSSTPMPRDPKLDLTSQQPQARFSLQQGRHLWGLLAATAGELSLVS